MMKCSFQTLCDKSDTTLLVSSSYNVLEEVLERGVGKKNPNKILVRGSKSQGSSQTIKLSLFHSLLLSPTD